MYVGNLSTKNLHGEPHGPAKVGPVHVAVTMEEQSLPYPYMPPSTSPAPVLLANSNTGVASALPQPLNSHRTFC